MARALTKESLLKNDTFLASAAKLYDSDVEAVAERYSSLTEGLNGKIRFFSASGRAELIGNHTDHNHGFVIASAIDMDVAAAVVATDDDFITVQSAGYPAFTVKLDDDKIDESKFGTSEALLKGVLKGFTDRKRKIGGFIARMQSNIFKGAGVSSSAAFELILCEILNVLYNDGEMDFKEKAIISQFAENVYFGKPSGLMDQLTASHGGVSYMDFFDPADPVARSLDWRFDDLKLVIINCGGDHCDLTDEYAAIRSEMNDVSAYFGKNVLRDVKKKEFFAVLPDLKNRYTGRALLRAIHFFEENERVSACYDALVAEDEEKFLSLITASGKSSYELLQNCYPRGDVAQPVALALAITERHPDTLACRVHGGGFAGTILSFVKKTKFSSYLSYMESVFGKENVFGVSVRNVGPCELLTEK